ncbi:CvpA family protein [Cellulosilyticum ruminicola]|uniref:CvpA family protein n=1 Tax=Cellulosilyticum ruminicola TaxID=425254 RepID=UPI0006D2C415|nr:CvpA family protein [Cellulosilyticum ruminicola]
MLDLIILGVLLIFAFVGMHRGLIDEIVTLLGSLGALILSFIVYPLINIILKLTPLYTYINEWVREKVVTIQFGNGVQSQGQAIVRNFTWLPDFMSETLVKNNNPEVYKALGANNIIDYVSISITNIIMSMLALLITWLVLKVVLVGSVRIIGKFVAKLPVISSLNKVGGFGIGIIKGLLTFWVITLVVPCIIAIPSYGGLETLIEGSVLFKWLYENNLVLLVFQQVF